MAIRIIDGKPGSGKSYYTVHHLVKNYFTEDRELYILKPGFCIITNIDSFKPAHIDLKTIATEHGGYDSFFTVEVQEKMKEQHGQIIYIIDEAQRIFRKNFKDDNVFFWFEYHRHLGQDIYLITQHYKKLPFDVYSLAEFIIYSAPRTRSVAGEFRYYWMDDGTKIKTEVLRPKQHIFALYKSMDMKEAEKIGNPVIKSALVTIAGVIVLVLIASRYLFGGVMWRSDEPAAASVTPSPAKSTLPPSPGLTSSPDQPSTMTWQSLSVIRTWSAAGMGELVVLDGALIPVTMFPYEIRRAGRSIYALVPDAPRGGAGDGSEDGSGSSGRTTDQAGADSLPPT